MMENTADTENVSDTRSMGKAAEGGPVVIPVIGDGAGGIFFEEEDINLDDYEIVRPEFFAHIKDPSFSVNVDKVTVNAACVRLLPDVEYVQILINKNQKKLLLLPCSETEITGYRWGRTKDGKRYPSTRTGEPFVLTLCKIMDWNPDYRYKVLGRLVRSGGKALVAFDLMSYECFPKTVTEDGKRVSRRSMISGDWNGRFGPTYAESQRSLEVGTFDGYTVFSIKNKRNKATQGMASDKPSEKVADGAESGKSADADTPKEPALTAIKAASIEDAATETNEETISEPGAADDKPASVAGKRYE